MKTMKTPVKNVASYISGFPPKTRKLLRQLRALIRKRAPKATEVVSYGIPGYKYHRTLVYFAGYDHHIGFYPGASAISTFKKALKPYKTSKGTVQFPLDQPLPAKLISDIVAFRVAENEAKAMLKKIK